MHQWRISCIAFIVFQAQTAMLFAVEGDAQLIDRALRAHRNNLQSIHTWSGTVNVTDTVDDDPATATTSSVVFSKDVKKGFLRWNWDLEFVRQPTHTLRRQYGIVTPESFISLTEDRGTILRKAARSVTALRPEDFSVSPSSFTFDPSYYLTRRGEDLIDRLTYFRDHADEEETSLWRVTEHEGVVTLAYHEPTLSNTYTIDVNRGGSLLSYEGKQGEAKDSWRCEYQRKGDAWVPGKLAIRSTYRVEDPSIAAEPVKFTTVQRELKWIQQAVNEPIDAKEFEIERIGVTSRELESAK